MAETRTIQVDYLARVEGEGALHVVLDGDRVDDVALKIFEPPRFFEAFLRGRRFTEAPDITARICGICPVAYQMSAVHAMEDACGVRVEGPLRALRRLLYCGEWIESHVLHIYMLHAPDFLGKHSVVELAKEHPAIVERGLRLKKAGNAIVALLGGREIHPINVRVGGFYKIPPADALDALRGQMETALDDALATVRWVSGFDVPDFEMGYEFVSLRHPDEYPFNEGRIASSRGLDITAREYHEHFEEVHVERSTALHCRLRERGLYKVGPLARYHLNQALLAPRAREAAREAGLGASCSNPFRSIVVRAVEVVHACEEALRILDALERPERPFVDVTPRAGTGMAATEAPRGLLHHTYRIDDDGLIEHAQIIPPTSQNQATIENDLRAFIAPRTALDDETLRWQCEQAVRNYDPCISCSTHFLDLTVERPVSMLVLGIGHPDRGDDGVGPRVGERVRERLPKQVEVASIRADLFAMLERWQGADTVLVVDAMRSGAAPGTVRRFDVADGGLGEARAAFAGTHSVNLGEAVELARSLGRLPRRLVVYGVEAAGFDLGTGLSPAVERAVQVVVERIVEECACTRHP